MSPKIYYLQRQQPELRFSSVVDASPDHSLDSEDDVHEPQFDSISDNESDAAPANMARALPISLEFFHDPRLNHFVKRFLHRSTKGRMSREQGKEMWALSREFPAFDAIEMKSYDTMERRVREVMPQPKVFWKVKILDSGEFVKGKGDSFPEKRYADKEKYEVWTVWTRLSLRELILYHGGKHLDCDFVEDGYVVFDKVHVTFTFDGIPCAKSTADTLTVMGLKFKGCRYVYIPQARIAKRAAAKNIHEFLDPFIEECKALQVTVDFLVADAPMRSFLKCLKGHAGRHSCEMCEARGTCVNRRICYPRTSLHQRRRTHAKWITYVEDLEEQRQFERTDHVCGITGRSPLMGLPGFNMVQQSPTDPMHRDWLGIVRMSLWKPTVGISKAGVMNARGRRIHEAVSSVYKKYRLPQEFTHRAREVDYANFKAQEWKCLTVTAFETICDVVLQEIGHELAHVWCLFAYLIFIHYGPQASRDKVGQERLEELHEALYDEFEDEFGAGACTFNWHSFSHLPEVAKLGSPIDMSTNAFESAYGLVQQSYAPATRNRGLQIVRNMLLRSINHSPGVHCKNNVIIEPTPDGLRHNDSIVVTEDLSFYKVKATINDNVIVYAMNTEPWSSKHDSTLDWSATGIALYKGLIERDICLRRSDIRGKGVMTAGNVLVPMYYNLLFS